MQNIINLGLSYQLNNQVIDTISAWQSGVRHSARCCQPGQPPGGKNSPFNASKGVDALAVNVSDEEIIRKVLTGL